MLYKTFSLIVLLGISTSLAQATDQFDQVTTHSSTDVEFVIVIPSYKNEEWAVENLRSACQQKSSRPFQVICINDCSPDRTGEIMDNYVKKHNLESFVTVIHNKENVGALTNWYNTIHSYIPDHKIVVNLDGDDLLAHDEVLLTLEKYYSDPDIWMTYGSAIAHPSGDYLPFMSQGIPDWVFSKKKIREYLFVSQHLRTFKAGLFKKIKKEDLMYKGAFAPAAVDMAFMLPMLEMCSPSSTTGKNHSIFIPEALYLYRTNNPLNLFRIRRKLQKDVDNFIRTKEPYEPLESLG